MEYNLEELTPILIKLSQKYTSFDSTSISYSTAEQLMGAITYCLDMASQGEDYSLSTSKLPLEELYEKGLAAVNEKTKQALAEYNQLMKNFKTYNVVVLKDTVRTGLFEFFKHYDTRFKPQDTILTLDYPVLYDLSDKKGINAIAPYIKCITIEQRFLSRFPREMIAHILNSRCKAYRLLFDNIVESVLGQLLISVLAKKSFKFPLTEEDYQNAENAINLILAAKKEDESKEAALHNSLISVTESMVKKLFDNDSEILYYLKLALPDITTRIINASKNGVLHTV